MCKIPDCPANTGGTCWGNLTDVEKEVVRELRTTLNIYSEMQLPMMMHVSENAWRAITGVIKDRIYQITGSKQ
jgi:hypothetical protein